MTTCLDQAHPCDAALARNRHWRATAPRGAVSLYFMILTLIVFAFIVMTSNFWAITYTRMSLQCAADCGALAGAEWQAHGLNQIAQLNDATISTWNYFVSDWRATYHHGSHVVDEPEADNPIALADLRQNILAAPAIALLQVSTWLAANIAIFEALSVGREAVARGSQLFAFFNAGVSADSNLRRFLSPSVANKCQIQSEVGEMLFNKRAYRTIYCYHFLGWAPPPPPPAPIPYWYNLPSSPPIPLGLRTMPLWWEKIPHKPVYTRVTITLPEDGLPFMGSGLFGKSPAITAIGQARSYGGSVYHTDRKTYPTYRTKLFPLRATPGGNFPLDTSSADYLH